MQCIFNVSVMLVVALCWNLYMIYLCAPDKRVVLCVPYCMLVHVLVMLPAPRASISAAMDTKFLSKIKVQCITSSPSSHMLKNFIKLVYSVNFIWFAECGATRLQFAATLYSSMRWRIRSIFLRELGNRKIFYDQQCSGFSPIHACLAFSYSQKQKMS